VACTGVHGANRLASNSLLEGLVFAERIGAALARGLPPSQEPAAGTAATFLLDASTRSEVAATMTEGAGVLRSAESLRRTLADLTSLAQRHTADRCAQDWEATNLHTVATFLATAARRREETRGSHWREDFPDRDDDTWRVRLAGRLVDGDVDLVTEPVG
jgi:L-aspartate oxidase